MTLIYKWILVILGIISVGLGFLGIFVPGLPTTPFLLLSAFLFFRSSERLYNWLIHHPRFGSYIRYYRIHKAIPLKTKIYATTLMWLMIVISTVFFIEHIAIDIIVIAAGVTGTIVMNFVIPTYKKK